MPHASDINQLWDDITVELRNKRGLESETPKLRYPQSLRTQA